MKLPEIKNQLKQEPEFEFRPDRKVYIELFHLAYIDDQGDCNFFRTSSDIFVAKELDKFGDPIIHWVRFRKSDFKNMLKGIKNNEVDILFVFEWGNDSGFDTLELKIECITEDYIYFVPVNEED